MRAIGESSKMAIRSRFTASAITCLLLFLVFLPIGSGLRCYSCLTKRSDPSSCEDPYIPQEQHERDCPPGYSDPVCYKVVLINAIDPRLGKKLYSRGCVSAEQYEQVIANQHADDGVRVLEVSRCTVDLCNV